ncbi:hypothetical protein LU293_06295 [Moraxella nasovis]|uniref:hypothetical protein n=1 Tax=Moraxella nasovis TaxID=2904121 RepID=UPI001F614DEC|nr:hypothetical protein [Moraxella nasovis]UNU72724.1 hypothetical protein LU293_06295 [Moraxella nasovis]
MTRQISTATVTGKSQNRTALGMMHAYLKKYPNTTLSELRAKFYKQNVCPDTGMDELFLTHQEIEQGKNGPRSKWYIAESACFVGDGEWLVLGDGQKVGFNKMWTGESLAILQQEMLQYQIFGQVDKSCKGKNGFDITYEYESQSKVETSAGMPIWVWIIGAAILLALAAYFFMN